MRLLLVSIAALIIGNLLRRSGLEAARANLYGTPASLAGQRRSCLGTWINIAGGICLAVDVVRLWPW
jgi:hypothetical protein